MQRSQRLGVVLAVEQRKEKQALERMGEARTLMAQREQQIQELQRYHQEYRQQIRDGQQGVIAVSRLQAWQAFMGQLDQLIGQQQVQLEQANQVFEVRRNEWLKAWEKRRGMENFITTCRQQEQREQDSREQKQADEVAGRAFLRRPR
ncbi:flagellar export protein FliJ [Marinobacter sp. M3C]|jgi:flagellar FliJ protein|uniref:flagellar export protein FliJ n=1 Tax=unclassified Marinobacter TaxID=83889 RepID=UPI00200C1515|nr:MULTISPECIES: flagellar export protein FliJ [unclassified Marinobacter]MCL1479144.1 flagellar export protein FliJ [Marinobacter sp.]MCL1485063.1 flagellar export protein FliJ [Marinobacter sp.]UQG57215.1 flagellar export protein FliJ [Marinobacter sp. M4C]UQG61602.1 flagellar export protein FliJ [Marinobacter sp. M3C]UQG66019.1 flagellar export protein FliJ [Marinobacter sp. M2C]